MIKPHHKLSAAVCAAMLATLACSLPVLSDGASDMEPTNAPATEPASPGPAVGTEVNPFLPTATPTVDVEALQAAFHVTGTITAELDGELMEWQTGSVDAEGEPHELSNWYRAPLQTIDDLYEFEIYAIDPSSMADAASTGAAAGTETLTFSFSIQSPTNGQEVTFPLPAGDELTGAAIGYLVPDGEQFSRYQMTSGELKLSLPSVEPGQPAELSGTFSGTLTYAGLLGAQDAELDPERTINVAAGELSLESLPYDPIFD